MALPAMDLCELKKVAPALWCILCMPFPWPGSGECHECPFSTAMYKDDPYRAPNLCAPGEGYYECSLLDKKGIWGEEPVCSNEDWRTRAKREIEGLVVKR